MKYLNILFKILAIIGLLDFSMQMISNGKIKLIHLFFNLIFHRY